MVNRRYLEDLYGETYADLRYSPYLGADEAIEDDYLTDEEKLMRDIILDELNDKATALAEAKAKADAAAAAYKQLEAEWKAQPEVQAAADAKKITSDDKNMAENEARKLLAELYAETNNTKLDTPYFGYRNSSQITVEDAAVTAQWLIENMPSVAVSLMANMIYSNDKFLLGVLKANSKNSKLINGFENVPGVSYWEKPNPVVNWSKLPEVEQG